MNLLQDKDIALVPATPGDKKAIFEWLAHSDLTHHMLGPPIFADNAVPTWPEFDVDYADFYFTGSDPWRGRCFIILKDDTPIGQINYNEIDRSDRCTELDIWLRHSTFTGKGYGTKALELLCNFLFQEFDLNRIYIAPSRRNTQAVRAYHKAGFSETDIAPSWFIPDYADAVLMIKYAD